MPRIGRVGNIATGSTEIKSENATIMGHVPLSNDEKEKRCKKEYNPLRTQKFGKK